MERGDWLLLLLPDFLLSGVREGGCWHGRRTGRLLPHAFRRGVHILVRFSHVDFQPGLRFELLITLVTLECFRFHNLFLAIGFSFPFQEFLAPSGVPSHLRGAQLLLDFCSQHFSCLFSFSGIQGERKVGTNREGEGEGQDLTYLQYAIRLHDECVSRIHV